MLSHKQSGVFSYYIFISRLLFTAIIAIFLLLHIDFVAYAEDIFETGQCGDNLTYTLLGPEDDLTLTISGTGDMWDYRDYMSEDHYLPPWYHGSEKPEITSVIAHVILDEGITSIGNYAFNGEYSCSISLPSTLERIGNGAFWGAGLYGDLIIPNGVTYIGERAFNNNFFCGKLSLPDNLTYLGEFSLSNAGTFNNEIVLPSKLTIIRDSVFESCNLTSVVLGSLVVCIDDEAFCNTGLKSIKFSDSVNYIGKKAFNETKLSDKLVMPKSVTLLREGAFYGTNLDTIVFYGNAPTIEEQVFDKSVTIEYDSKAVGFTSPSWHGYNAIANGEPDPEPEPGLEPIIVTGLSLSPEVKTIKQGEEVTITAILNPDNPDNTGIHWSINGSPFQVKNDQYTFSTNITGTYYIQAVSDDGGFFATSTITVTEKEQDQEPDPEDENNENKPQEDKDKDDQPDSHQYFYTIVFDGDNDSTVVIAERVAADTEFVLPQNTYTKEGYKFKNWQYSLGGNTYYAADGASIMITEAALKVNGIDVVKFTAQWEKNEQSNTEKNTGSTITDKKSRARYVVSSSKRRTVKYTGPANRNARSITIPSTVSSNGITYRVTEVCSKAFKGNGKLTTIRMGSNIVKIGDEAFSGCIKLTTVEIGTNVTAIGYRAFYDCKSLKSLKLPASTNRLGKQFIGNCPKFKTLYIKSTKLTMKTVSVGACSNLGKNVVVKVPKSKVSAYKKILYNKGLNKRAKIQAEKLFR